MYPSIFLCLAAAAALSLDGFAAGVALGLKKLRIGWLPRLCLALFSAAFAAISLFGGQLLGEILPPAAARLIGGGGLICLGFTQLFSNLLPPPQTTTHHIFHLLGLTILVIREPAAGDLDASGAIDPREALLLGLSLSVDMLGAGVGLSLSGEISLWLIPAVGIAQAAFLSIGQLLGERLSTSCAIPKHLCNLFSGCLILLLGILRLSGIF